MVNIIEKKQFVKDLVKGSKFEDFRSVHGKALIRLILYPEKLKGIYLPRELIDAKSILRKLKTNLGIIVSLGEPYYVCRKRGLRVAPMFDLEVGDVVYLDEEVVPRFYDGEIIYLVAPYCDILGVVDNVDYSKLETLIMRIEAN